MLTNKESAMIDNYIKIRYFITRVHGDEPFTKKELDCVAYAIDKACADLGYEINGIAELSPESSKGSWATTHELFYKGE